MVECGICGREFETEKEPLAYLEIEKKTFPMEYETNHLGETTRRYIVERQALTLCKDCKEGIKMPLVQASIVRHYPVIEDAITPKERDSHGSHVDA